MSQDVVARSTRVLVDGEWLDGRTEFSVSDLADGGTFARVAGADEAQARQAIEAAVNAEDAIASATVPERATWLEAIADGIRDRSEELAETVVREAGKPIASARGEVDAAAKRFERAVEEARNIEGDFVQGSADGHAGWEAIRSPEPVGTVLCISPYNYPVATTALQVAPALAAGNSVVLKPSSETPVSGSILAEIVEEAGLPDGAFNFVPGRGSEIGDVLAGAEEIRAIAMTGSSGAGQHVAKQSGITRLHMELGGNAPLLVFEDADLEAATAAAAKGGFKLAGQRCSAVSRVVAHESVVDEVVDRLVEEREHWSGGDLFDEETDYGPLISESHAETVEAYVEDALDRGARVVAGGERDGQRFEPTILADVPRDARIVTEEHFGPVLPVVSFETDEEAVDVANDTELGLDAAVFTADYERARSVAHDLQTGNVRINGAPSHGIGDIAFGGVGQSGIGREGIGVTVEEFLEYKTIVL